MNQDSEASPVTAPSENLLGPRILAGFIDLVLLLLLGFVMSLLFGSTSSTTQGDETLYSFEADLSGLAFIAYIVLALGYYFVMEALSGQTLGKKAVGLRVVAVDGRLTAGKVAGRTLLRLIDGFVFYLVAVLVIAVSANQQRLGDKAAGTRVVRA